MSNERQGNSIESSKILGSRGFIIKVDKKYWFQFLQPIKRGFINVFHISTKLGCGFGVSKEIAQSPHADVIDLLTILHEVNSRKAMDAHLFTKTLLDITIDFANVQRQLHITSHLGPSTSHGLTVMAPWGVKFDEPRVFALRHS